MCEYGEQISPGLWVWCLWVGFIGDVHLFTLFWCGGHRCLRVRLYVCVRASGFGTFLEFLYFVLFVDWMGEEGWNRPTSIQSILTHRYVYNTFCVRIRVCVYVCVCVHLLMIIWSLGWCADTRHGHSKPGSSHYFFTHKHIIFTHTSYRTHARRTTYTKHTHTRERRHRCCCRRPWPPCRRRRCADNCPEKQVRTFVRTQQRWAAHGARCGALVLLKVRVMRFHAASGKKPTNTYAGSI